MQTRTREERERASTSGRPRHVGVAGPAGGSTQVPKFLSEDKVRHTADTEIKVSARTATTQIFARSLIC